jgi:DNA-binding transcriptional LysR family regulator
VGFGFVARGATSVEAPEQNLLVSTLSGAPGATEIRLEDLSEEEWLLSPSQRLIMVESGAEIGTIPQVAFEDPTPTVVRSLVLAGEGIANLGESEVDFWQPATILAFTDQGGPELPPRPIRALRRRRPDYPVTPEALKVL